MQATDKRIDEAVFAELVPINALSPQHRKELLGHAKMLSVAEGETFSTQTSGSEFTYYLLVWVLHVSAQLP